MKSAPHPQKQTPPQVSHLCTVWRESAGLWKQDLSRKVQKELLFQGSWPGLALLHLSVILLLLLPAPITQNCKVKNIVCMSLAGVVLLILAVILAEAWHSQRGANNDLGNADKRAPLRQVRPQDLKGTFQML